MATQPQEIIEQEQDNAPVDFEAEARKMGWKAAEEFKGDPGQHVDAETFYKKGQELMPILRAQNKALLKRLDTMERDQKRASEFFTKAEERAYTRALEDIRAKQEKAVEEGDVEAHRQAVKELDKLEKPNAKPIAEDDPEQRAEEFADWGKENKWYATNPIMQAYAEAQASAISKKKGSFLDRSDLDRVTELVKAKFPEEFEAPKRTARNPVEGGGTAPGRRAGNTYNDLPQEAKALCDRWVKSGLIKSREDYVKGYSF